MSHHIGRFRVHRELCAGKKLQQNPSSLRYASPKKSCLDVIGGWQLGSAEDMIWHSTGASATNGSALARRARASADVPTYSILQSLFWCPIGFNQILNFGEVIVVEGRPDCLN
jgi:hypothetical protein